MALLAGRGVNGVVTDSATGLPLLARVELIDPERWHTYTAARSGGFARMVEPGTYDICVTANGYESKTISGVVVPDSVGAFVEVALAPSPASPMHALKALSLRRIDNSHTYSDWYLRALGVVQLGPGGIALAADNHRTAIRFADDV